MPVYERHDTKSRRFYYKFSLDGIVYKKNIPTARTRRQAEEAERHRRDEIHAGVVGKGRDILFEKFVEDHYLPYVKQHNVKYRHYEYMTRILVAEFRGHSMRQISQIAIEKMKQRLGSTKTYRGNLFQAATINAIRSCLSGIFTLAIEYGFLRENPCRRVKRLPAPPEKCRVLEPEEEDRLMTVLESDREFLKPVVQLALWTGFRLNELLSLRSEHIDFTRNLIFVVNPKWKRDKRKTEGNPIDPETKDLLRSLCGQNVLFVNDRSGKPVTEPALSKAFERACDKAGIEGLGFHGLRHTFGTRLADSGANLKHIARLMGHANTTMTERYIHPSESSLMSVLRFAKRNPEAQIRTSSGITRIAESA